MFYDTCINKRQQWFRAGDFIYEICLLFPYVPHTALIFRSKGAGSFSSSQANPWVPPGPSMGESHPVFSPLRKSQIALAGHHRPPIWLFGEGMSHRAACFVPWFIEAWPLPQAEAARVEISNVSWVSRPNSFKHQLENSKITLTEGAWPVTKISLLGACVRRLLFFFL